MAKGVLITKSQEDNAEDPRIHNILNLIYELAAGNLEARGTISENEDELDGVIAGLNLLAEEIAGSVFKINKLSGLLPICAWCKKIRNDKEYWQTVEQYIGEHTQAEFTHGMCPECYEKIVAGIDSRENNSSKVS